MRYFVWYAYVITGDDVPVHHLGRLCLLWLWGYTGAASWLCYVRLCFGSVIVMLRLLLRLLRQPGKRLCCGCHAHQERINISAVPVAPQVSFQSLSLSLANLDSMNSADSVNSKTVGCNCAL